MFVIWQGFRRHQKFCQGASPTVSSVEEVTVAKIETEPVQDSDLEVVADPLAPDMMDNALRDKMKGGPLM